MEKLDQIAFCCVFAPVLVFVHACQGVFRLLTWQSVGDRDGWWAFSDPITERERERESERGMHYCRISGSIEEMH